MLLLFIFQIVVGLCEELYLEIEKNKNIFNLPIDLLKATIYLYI